MKPAPGTAPSERAYQAAIVELAYVLGWTVAHFRAARTSRGWRTPVAADGAGWPDLVLVRGSRLLAAELKAARGKVSVDQQAWLELLAAAGVECHVWRADTDSLQEIAEALR